MTDEAELDIPIILNQQLFAAIEKLAKDALAYGANHTALRADVNALLHQFRRVAQDNIKGDCIEALRLQRLLKATTPPQPENNKKPREVLAQLENLERRAKISSEQYQAALLIKSVWTAFEKYMGMGAKNYGKGSGGSNKAAAPQPIDAMSDELFEFYRGRYTPWSTRSKTYFVKVKARGGMDIRSGYSIYIPEKDNWLKSPGGGLRVFLSMSHATAALSEASPGATAGITTYTTRLQIVQAVILDEVALDVLDRKYGFERGGCLALLQESLTDLMNQDTVEHRQEFTGRRSTK